MQSQCFKDPHSSRFAYSTATSSNVGGHYVCGVVLAHFILAHRHTKILVNEIHIQLYSSSSIQREREEIKQRTTHIPARDGLEFLGYKDGVCLLSFGEFHALSLGNFSIYVQCRTVDSQITNIKAQREREWRCQNSIIFFLPSSVLPQGCFKEKDEDK